MNNKFLPPVGPTNCKIALVGEAPGENEMDKMEPFVGSTGKLNDALLASAGIFRGTCFLTNVWRVRIVGKTAKFPYDYIKAHPDAYNKFKELLQLELESTSANIIVALGELALFTLTGEVGVTRKRGSVYKCTLVEGRKVMAMRHPSAALPFRNFCLQYIMMHDYKKVKVQSEFPDIRLPKRKLILNPHSLDVLNYLEKIKRDKLRVACDIESPKEVGEITHISFAIAPDDAICIPFKYQGVNFYNEFCEREIWYAIAEVLEDPEIEIIGQNFSYDATYMFRKYGIRSTNIRDTLQGMGILYASLPPEMKYKGLAFICSLYTDENYYKDDGKEQPIGGFGEERFQEYNAKDSAITLEAEVKIARDLKEIGNEQAYLENCALIEPLVYMSEHGINVNVPGLEKAAEDALIEIGKLQEEMFRVMGADIVIGKDGTPTAAALKKYFYGKEVEGGCGLPPYRSMKKGSKGGITVDKTAMQRIARKGYSEAKLVLDIRFLGKRRSTYYTTKLSEDNRFKCSYNPYSESGTKAVKKGGAKGGRLTSGTNIFGEGTNAQNLPDEMLKLLLADEGYIFYDIDLEQAENRIVAYTAPEPRMIEAFESGADVHKLTAGLILDKDESDVSDEEGSCFVCANPKTCGHSERFWGKKANHSLNYGEGYRLFSLINLIPETKGKIIVQKYLTKYSGIGTYHKWISNALYKNRRLTNPFGRVFWYMDNLNMETMKKAYSFIPQSTVARIINQWGLMYIWENFPDVELLLQRHDSIGFQIPLKLGWYKHAEILIKIKENLEQEIQWKSSRFTIPCDCKMGFNMLDTRKVKLTTVEETTRVLQQNIKMIEWS